MNLLLKLSRRKFRFYFTNNRKSADGLNWKYCDKKPMPPWYRHWRATKKPVIGTMVVECRGRKVTQCEISIPYEMKFSLSITYTHFF